MTPSRATRLRWTARMLREAASQSRFGFRSPETIRRVQEQRLRAAVAHAHAHVPYYRETMRRLLIDPGDLRTAADLARLPLIERDQLQQDPEYFVSDRWPPATCVELRSGGSTGLPLSIFRDPGSLFAEAAHYERLRSVIARLAGRRLRYREAVIRPENSSSARVVTAFRSANRLPKRVVLRAFPLRVPAELLPQLNEYRPEVIGTYGSYLEELFTYVRDHNPAFAAPRVAVYGADPLAPSARAWAREALGIEILSNYGAVEAPHIGFECERHRGYHLNVDLHPARLIDADGRELSGPGTGELVVSNLVNRGTVLLNYRLGDVVTLPAEPCPCGRSLPLCAFLERTKLTWLTVGAGRRVHAQDFRVVLHGHKQIRRFQVVQEDERRLLIRIVAAPDSDLDALRTQVLDGLRAELPDDVTVRTEYVDHLPREASGKVRSTIPLATSGRG